MKPFPRLLPVIALFAAASTSLVAATVGQAVAAVQRERVQSSYLVAFGRLATEDEVKYWAGQNPKSVSDLVTRHRDYLSRDKGTHQDTIKRSYASALGKNPNAGEINHWMGGNDTYTTLVNNHISWLRSNPNEYAEVIKRSYQAVLRRQPTAAEINYWKGQGVLAYSVLAACHEDFKRQGGERKGAATLPTSSSFLSSVPVSPGVLAETKTAIGGGIVAAGGGNIVAAGAGNIVAAGGGNIVAAGAGNVVSPGGAN